MRPRRDGAALTGPTGLRDALAALAAEQAAAPLPAFAVAALAEADRIVLRGRVLTWRQAEAVARLAREHGGAVEVAVVADPAAELELGWVEAAGGGALELWRDPARIGEDAARQTEYLAEDGPLRLLGRAGGAALLQGRDLTLGWTPAAAVREVETGAARAAWGGVARAEAGAAVLPPPAALPPAALPPAAPPPAALPSPPPGARPWGRRDGEPEPPATGVLDALLAGARARLGAPYRWGGTTPAGYDCSGLVQRVFSDATQVLLPKHTADQRRVGLRVAADERAAGDLMFATPLGQRVGHVMLLTSPDTVLHACRTEHRVVEESLADNALRYRHQGCRRPVLLHA